MTTGCPNLPAFDWSRPSRDIDETHVVILNDAWGEPLRCEFSVYQPAEYLRTQECEELRLRSVTFGGGAGVEVLSQQDHEKFLTIIRKDELDDHYCWQELEAKCREEYREGRTEVIADRIRDDSPTLKAGRQWIERRAA